MATVYRRGETWYGCFKHRGKKYRPCLNTPNKRLAEQRLRKVITDLEMGSGGLPTKTAAGEVVSEFIQHLYAHHRKRAVNKEIYRLREFFGPVCPELTRKSKLRMGVGTTKKKGKLAVPSAFAVKVKYIEDVTTGMISTFIRRKVSKQGIKAKTANEYREIVQRLFQWAIDQRGIRMPQEPRTNPASAVKTYRVPAPEIRFLRMKDIWEQLRALESDPRVQTMVAVYIFAGLRREEALWLTRQDVDLPRRLIYVKAKTVAGEFWQPKTARNRVVPISNVLLRYLSDYRPPAESAWYFPSPNGCRWDPDNFSNALRKINRQAELSWSCQDYRHTFGSHLAMKGESLYKISELMGNSPEICRRHYARLLDESLVESVEFVQAEPAIQLRPAAAG